VRLIDVNVHAAQFSFSLFNFTLQLLVCLGHIVESEDG
jgi:hypothetical protein